MIVGGLGPKMTPRLAAGYASEYNATFITPDLVALEYERVRAACEAAGRDPAILTLSTTECCFWVR